MDVWHRAGSCTLSACLVKPVVGVLRPGRAIKDIRET